MFFNEAIYPHPVFKLRIADRRSVPMTLIGSNAVFAEPIQHL